MTLDHLKTLVNEDLYAVNALIIEKLHSQIGLIDNLAQHIMQSGGKRLRPLLVLLASRACNYTGQEHIALAAMVEFFHTATLLHDDVVDGSTLRRGRETANEIWGSKASVLVGDYLFTQSVQLMVNIDNIRILRLFASTSHAISCGEVKQLVNRHNFALSIPDYLDIIKTKTALLFAASASAGGYLGGKGEAIEKSLYDYGLHLGNAFQLIDDVLDYCSHTKIIGKNIGDDLAEGKLTLPLLHALQHGSTSQKEFIKQSIQEDSIDNLGAILTIIKETKAIEATKDLAALEIEQALQALTNVPDSIYKQALIDLAQFAIQREH